MQWPPVMQGLLQGVQDEAGPYGDIGEVRKPEPISCRGMELAVHLVERTRSRVVADRCADRFAANDTLQAEVPHQPLHRTSRNIEPFPLHLPPNLADTIDREVLGKDSHDLGLEGFIALGTADSREGSRR